MTEQFRNQKYINMETFRKNGLGVKTPVWFAKDGESFYVWTEADSGKAKRIRRDGTVKIVPATASGQPLGEWVAAQATADATPEALDHIRKLMQKKYGLAFRAFGLMGKLRKANYTAIKLQVDG
ncbi:MAG: PPOX class F420-dependent oxidoreductase [Anaerolineales bacterium]|nr:PPOX class F420-dependent oxidoreductase [Anaerolineales bacterium]